MRYELAVEIERPPAEVYAFLADPGNLARWQEDVVEVRDVAGAPLARGSTFTEVRSFVGKRVESALEVTAAEAGRELSLRTVSGPVRLELSHLVEPRDGGTLLTLAGDVDPGKAFGLAWPLLRKVAERRARADLDRLKAVLEAAN